MKRTYTFLHSNTIIILLFFQLIALTDIYAQGTLNCSSGVSEVVYSESWEKGVDHWTGVFNKSKHSWYLNSGGTGYYQTGPSGAYDSTNYIHFHSFYSGVATMVSPPIDLSLANNQAELSFWIHGYGTGIPGSRFSIDVGLSPTGPFNAVYDTLIASEISNSSSDPWVKQTVDISSYTGQVIYLRIKDSVNNPNITKANLALDLLEITACVSCAKPTDLSVIDYSDSLVTINWTENQSASQWQLEWGPTGYTPGSGGDTVVTSKPFVLPLLPGKKYDYYVRAICSAGDTSYRSNKVTHQKRFIGYYNETFEYDGSWPPTMARSSEKARITENENKAGSDYAMKIVFKQGEFACTPEIDTKKDTNIISFNHTVENFNGLSLHAEVQYWNGSSWDSLTALYHSKSAGWFSFRDTVIASNSDFKLRFYMVSTFPSLKGSWIIDDIRIEGIRNCTAPMSLSADSLLGTSANLSWIDTNGATQWFAEIEEQSNNAISTFDLISSNNPHTLNGLNPVSRYKYSVSAICAAGDTSYPSVPYTFYPARKMPYLLNFSYIPYDMRTNNAAADPNLFVYGKPGAFAETPVLYSNSDTAVIYFDWRNGMINPPEASDQATVQYWDGNSWNHLPGWPKSGSHDIWSSYSAHVVYTNDDFRIRFRVINGSGVNYDDWNFDNLEVYGANNCLPPRSLSFIDTSYHSVEINGDVNIAMTSYQVSYGDPGFSAGTAYDTVVQSLPATINGLESGRFYDVYVRSICSASDTSAWSDTLSVHTVADEYFFEDFEHDGNWPLSLLSGNHEAVISTSCYSSGKYMAYLDGVPGTSFTTPGCNIHSDTVIVSFLYRNGCNDSPDQADSYSVKYWNGTSWMQMPGWPKNDIELDWIEYKDTIFLSSSHFFSLKFSVDNGSGAGYDDWQVDDIRIFGPQLLDYPASLSDFTLSSNSVHLEWSQIAGVPEYQLQWYDLDAGSNLNFGPVVSSNSVLLDTLNQNAHYLYRVRGISALGDTTMWSSFSKFQSANSLQYIVSWEDGFQDWTNVDYDNRNWSIGDEANAFLPSNAKDGKYFMWCNTDKAAQNDTFIIESPYFDFSDVALPALVFYNYLNNSNEIDGSLTIDASNDHGQSWSSIWSISGDRGDVWRKDTCYLPTLPGDSTVMLRFVYIVGNSTYAVNYHVAVDDFRVVDMSCPMPSNISVSYIHPTFANISWKTGGAQSWNLEYGPSGFQVGTGTRIMDVSYPYALTGLNPVSKYDVYVQDSCGPGASSHWVGPLSFSTPAALSCTNKKRYPLFQEKWENGIGNWTGDIASGMANAWRIRNGSTSPANAGPDKAYEGSSYMEASASEPGTIVLYSPAIDLQLAAQNVMASFWYHAHGPGIPASRLKISAALDTAGPYTTIWDTVFNDQVQTSSSSPYLYQTVDLSQFAGQTIYLKFTYTIIQYANADLAIDMLELNGCVDPFNEMAVVGSAPLSSGCGLNVDTVKITIANNGTDTIPASTSMRYTVNGGYMSVTENLGEHLLPGCSREFSFSNLIDLSTLNYDSLFDVKVFCSLPGDTIPINDTAYYSAYSFFEPQASVDNIVILEGQQASLIANRDYNSSVYWYESQNGINSIFMGDTLQTAPLYNDTSYWYQAKSRDIPVLITDLIFFSNPDVIYLEVSNVSDEPLDVSGWHLEFNKDNYLDSVASQSWQLNPGINGQSIQMKFFSDATGMWTPGWQKNGKLWIALVHESGEVVDFLARGFSAAELNNMNVDIGKYQNWNPVKYKQWSGHGVQTDSVRTERIVFDSNNSSDWSASSSTVYQNSYNQNMIKHGSFKLDGCSSPIDSVKVFVKQKISIDAGIVDIAQPGYFNNSLNPPVELFLVNFGTDTIFTCDIQFGTASPYSSYTYNGALGPGDTAAINISGISLSYGTSEFCAYTSIASDTNIFNDGLCKPVHRQYTAGIPYIDGFEGKDYFMKDTANLKGTLWERTFPDGNIKKPNNGSKCWIIDADDVYRNNLLDVLYSPLLDPDTVSFDSLVFWHYFNSEAQKDGGYVQYLNDSGGWSMLGTHNDSTATNWYNGSLAGGTPSFTGFSNGWIRSAICIDSIHIPDMAPIAQFRFVFTSDSVNNNGDGWAIDDFWVRTPKVSFDAGVVAINKPVDTTIIAQSSVVEVEIKNFGNSVLNSIPVTYKLSDSLAIKTTETWTGTLLPDSIAYFSFNTTYSGPASDYQLISYTELPNDGKSYNDTTKTDLVAHL